MKSTVVAKQTPRKVSGPQLFFLFPGHLLIPLSYNVLRSCYAPGSVSHNDGQDRPNPCPPEAYIPGTRPKLVAFLELPLLNGDVPRRLSAPSVSLLPTPCAETKPDSNATSSGTPPLAGPSAVTADARLPRPRPGLTGSCAHPPVLGI